MTTTKIPTILEKILQTKRTEITHARATVGEAALQRQAAERLAEDPPRGFARAIQAKVAQAAADLQAPPAVIAEVKKASPSKGVIRPDFDPVAFARSYEKGGATCLSVLTDQQYFQGHDDFLRQARASVSLPVLRKDFIVTPYQIHEARAHGADLVLLIVAALEQPALVSLLERVRSLGMEALVEAHSRLEVLRALEAGASVIGVNARDLTTLEVDRHTIEQVIDVIPEDVVAVAESGVSNAHDVFEYAKWGADAVLVGEALVTSGNPLESIRDMVSAGAHPALLTDRKARVRQALQEG